MQINVFFFSKKEISDTGNPPGLSWYIKFANFGVLSPKKTDTLIVDKWHSPKNKTQPDLGQFIKVKLEEV